MKVVEICAESKSLDCLGRSMRNIAFSARQARQNRLSICGSKCLWGERSTGEVGLDIYLLSAQDQIDRGHIEMDIFRDR